MIGSIVLRDSELVGIAGESDDLRTTSEQLGVLNGIPAESTDTQNPDHPTRAERASIAKFFHATEGCPSVSSDRCLERHCSNGSHSASGTGRLSKCAWSSSVGTMPSCSRLRGINT